MDKKRRAARNSAANTAKNWNRGLIENAGEPDALVLLEVD